MNYYKLVLGDKVVDVLADLVQATTAVNIE